MHHIVYPFTAIVGQENMRRALILNAINPAIGGVLLRGEKGTAKSTAARALAALLPEMEVIADSPFNDNPRTPSQWSDYVREKYGANGKVQVDIRRTPFINLPVSATEDRVVGTLDIEKALKKGEKHFEPGILAAANRGILYVDEVNLLDDHIVDLLLDSAAMGINIVEREGISFQHPAKFILVGTMNPEEGELRPQLLDRFAHSVEIKGINDVQERIHILERRIIFDQDPIGFYEAWRDKEEELSHQITEAQGILDNVVYTQRELYMIANLTASLKVDGHRADLVILKTARANAAFEGRTRINDHDILIAAQLALPHRMKRNPFSDASLDTGEVEGRLEEISSDWQGGEEAETSETGESAVKKKSQSVATEAGEDVQDFGHTDPAPQNVFDNRDAYWWEGGKKVKSGQEFTARQLDTPLDRLTKTNKSGRRTNTITERKRGHYIRSRPASGDYSDVALDATIRAAAPYQTQRDKGDMAYAIETEDIQKKIRVKKAANLILFVVDASWSMAVAERMSATKGAILSLLTDAYQRRDRVGLIVFQKDRATLILSPTNSVTMAKQALSDIPVGGKTPLSAGLQMAREIFRRETISHPDVMPLMILLTDGAGNVSMSDVPPQEEAHYIAEQMKEESIRSVIINMEHTAFDQGLAQKLADALGGPCYSVAELKAEILYQTVQAELNK